MDREKIGVGIITYNRPDYFKQCVSTIPWAEIDECIVVKDGGGEDYVVEDTANFHYYAFETNGGVSRSKNKALEYLLEKKCEHIFLIEDDMLIKNPKVFAKYIETAYRTGIYHLMFLKVSDNALHKRATIDGIDLHKSPQGSFMYILSRIVKHIGYFDVKFKNAFEHIDWTYRAIQKGLLPPFWWFPDIENSQELIEEISGSSENSSITNKEGYEKNWQQSAKHWINKHGLFTNQIEDVSQEQVIQRLNFLKKHYSKNHHKKKNTSNICKIRANDKKRISFLIPVTSRGRTLSVESLPFYQYVLSSFDFDDKYEYQIFLGADSDDKFYAREDVKDKILSIPNVTIEYFNDTSHNPVKVWNYLFKKAYDKGFDYFYQLGDDIQIITKKSIDRFIEVLQSINNIGVTGPQDINHSDLLTQSFVHRTHMEVFGFYYPHEFTNWYCDNWIQEVYKPSRTVQLTDVHVRNCGGPCRYIINDRSDFMKFVERDRQILYKYISDNL